MSDALAVYERVDRDAGLRRGFAPRGTRQLAPAPLRFVEARGSTSATVRDPVADALPHRAEALRAIEARLFDLLVVVGSSVYHPAFHGSFSLKRVVPVLVPGIGYDDLTIADGQTPAVEYAPALASPDLEQRRRTFDDLRNYCARDTLAMVKLRRALALLRDDEAPHR